VVPLAGSLGHIIDGAPPSHEESDSDREVPIIVGGRAIGEVSDDMDLDLATSGARARRHGDSASDSEDEGDNEGDDDDTKGNNTKGDNDAPPDVTAGIPADATPAQRYEALQAKYQLNLDNAGGIEEAGLEDPRLFEHTAQRRQLLLEAERKREAELPDPELLEKDNLAARRAMSSLVTTLEELRSAVDCEASNLCALRVGGAPADIATAGRKVRTTAESLLAIVQQIAEAQKFLTIARRQSEAAIDGEKRWVGHYREVARLAQAPAVQVAPPAEAAPPAAEPGAESAI